jgi:hypothetical protein
MLSKQEKSTPSVGREGNVHCAVIDTVHGRGRWREGNVHCAVIDTVHGRGRWREGKNQIDGCKGRKRYTGGTIPGTCVRLQT